MSLFVPNRYRGKLIVVEGIDGSGKSTQLSLLSHWLRSQGFAVAFSEWNSSPLVRETNRSRQAHRGGGHRRLREIDPTFSLEPLAAFAGLRSGLQRVEFFPAGPRDHPAGQEKGNEIGRAHV